MADTPKPAKVETRPVVAEKPGQVRPPAVPPKAPMAPRAPQAPQPARFAAEITPKPPLVEGESSSKDEAVARLITSEVMARIHPVTASQRDLEARLAKMEARVVQLESELATNAAGRPVVPHVSEPPPPKATLIGVNPFPPMNLPLIPTALGSEPTSVSPLRDLPREALPSEPETAITREPFVIAEQPAAPLPIVKTQSTAPPLPAAARPVSVAPAVITAPAPIAANVSPVRARSEPASALDPTTAALQKLANETYDMDIPNAFDGSRRKRIMGFFVAFIVLLIVGGALAAAIGSNTH